MDIGCHELSASATGTATGVSSSSESILFKPTIVGAGKLALRIARIWLQVDDLGMGDDGR